MRVLSCAKLRHADTSKQKSAQLGRGCWYKQAHLLRPSWSSSLSAPKISAFTCIAAPMYTFCCKCCQGGGIKGGGREGSTAGGSWGRGWQWAVGLKGGFAPFSALLLLFTLTCGCEVKGEGPSVLATVEGNEDKPAFNDCCLVLGRHANAPFPCCKAELFCLPCKHSQFGSANWVPTTLSWRCYALRACTI